MELKHAIDEARDLTRQLKVALDTQDMELWLSLLDDRGRAMVRFESAHREAPVADRDACRGDLMELQLADEDLQGCSEHVLEGLAEEFREQLKRPAQVGHAAGNDEFQACLDRKA